MKREIRDEREKLYRESLKMRQIANETSGKKSFEIREAQDKMYNKWKFYTNMIREMEKPTGDNDE